MKELSFKVADTTYRATELNARQWETLLESFKKEVPDPVAEVVENAKLLPEGTVRDEFLKAHLDEAFKAKRGWGTVSNTAFQDWIKTPFGLRKVAHLCLQRYHPDLTEDEALGIFVQHGEQLEALKTGSLKVPLTEEAVEDKYFRGNRTGTKKRK